MTEDYLIKDVGSFCGDNKASLVNQKNAIAFHHGHDTSIAIKIGEKYFIYELERFTKKRYAKIGGWQRGFHADKSDAQESMNCMKAWLSSIKKDIEKECKFPASFGVMLLQAHPRANYHAIHCQETRFTKMAKRFFNVESIVPFGHHYSHAAASFYQSPFEKALVISIDGVGLDFGVRTHFNIYHATKTWGCQKLKTIDIRPGRRYRQMAHFIKEIPACGLAEAGKLMGLCAYGKVQNDWIDAFKFHYLGGQNGMGNATGIKRLLRIETKDQEDFLMEQVAFDAAATSQFVFEELIMKEFEKIYSEYKLPICMTGGCALNVLLNEKLRKRLQKDGTPIFIPPNPNDSGIATGALLGCVAPKDPPKLTYRGMDLLDRKQLNQYIKKYNAYKCNLKEIAQLLANGKIIGVVAGRSEVGPRALGNRSIICDPSYEKMKDILNSKVKFREWFRPFAPVVRKEDVSKYFDFEGESEYMSFAPSVLEERRKDIPAVVHVDGSARVQTVTRKQHEFFYDVIGELEKITGVGVILNTSFNIKGAPILTTIEDALSILENTELDYALIEGYLFQKQN